MDNTSPLFYALFGFFSAVSLACLALPFILKKIQRTEKDAEQKILESNKFLEAILDALPVALFCKDYQNDLKFFIWNKHAEKMFGLKSEQMIGKSDEDFFPPDQVKFFRAKDTETMIQGKVIEIEQEKVLTPNGERLLHTIKVPVKDAEGKPRFLVGISEDITDDVASKKLIEEQRLTIIHAEKMTALGEIAGGIAHEINNPLAVIQGKIELLRMYAAENRATNEQIQKTAEVITNTVTRITKIIRGLKNFARDGEKDRFEKIKIAETISDLFDLCHARFANHNVDLQLAEINSELVIDGRSVQISQVLINLVNNAFDAVAGTKNAFVKISLEEKENLVEIRITDSGPGISPEIADKIMQPFFTTKEVGKGTGLGLSISEGIIKTHNGELYLDRKQKQTSFVIVLPKEQKNNT